LASKYAFLDYISKGHVTRNVVTTLSADKAPSFGFTAHLDAKVCDKRADDFIEVTQKFGDCEEEDAFLYTMRPVCSSVFFPEINFR